VPPDEQPLAAATVRAGPRCLIGIPAGEPMLAAVAPDNAASVPALLSAEFIPLG
jgi:hypothetical protein